MYVYQGSLDQLKTILKKFCFSNKAKQKQLTKKNLKFIKLAQLKNNNSKLEDAAMPGLAAYLAECSNTSLNLWCRCQDKGGGKEELGQNSLSQGHFINQMK